MKVIQFLVNYAPYRAGDIAGFEDKLADAFIEKKYADLVPASTATTKTKSSTKK